jgi:RluA family pseudouridine synthase
VPRINSSFTATIRNPGKDSLIEYLVRRFTYHPQEEWQRLLSLKRLELQGVTATGSEKIREGQILKFEVVDYDEPDVPLDFYIVHQSSDLCLVHKPPGMPVHRTGKIFFQTLANLVREQLGNSSWAPLNRLDRETGGLIAFAKGAEAFRQYAPSNPDVIWVKLYAAVVQGRLPAQAGIMSFSLGETGLGEIRTQVQVLADGKPALSLYHVISENEGKTLLILAPITGRKHQLRVHLAELGCPIIGDKIYSQNGAAYLKQLSGELEEADYSSLGARHHLLHAFHLRLEKPGIPPLVGWDWDFGKEFAQYFSPNLIQEWAQGRQFQELVLEAETARLTWQSTKIA